MLTPSEQVRLPYLKLLNDTPVGAYCDLVRPLAGTVKGCRERESEIDSDSFRLLGATTISSRFLVDVPAQSTRVARYAVVGIVASHFCNQMSVLFGDRQMPVLPAPPPARGHNGSWPLVAAQRSFPFETFPNWWRAQTPSRLAVVPSLLRSPASTGHTLTVASTTPCSWPAGWTKPVRDVVSVMAFALRASARRRSRHRPLDRTRARYRRARSSGAVAPYAPDRPDNIRDMSPVPIVGAPSMRDRRQVLAQPVGVVMLDFGAGLCIVFLVCSAHVPRSLFRLFSSRKARIYRLEGP